MAAEHIEAQDTFKDWREKTNTLIDDVNTFIDNTPVFEEDAIQIALAMAIAMDGD